MFLLVGNLFTYGECVSSYLSFTLLTIKDESWSGPGRLSTASDPVTCPLPY